MKIAWLSEFLCGGLMVVGGLYLLYSGFERVQALVEVIRNDLTFVFILLKDPGSASTVFEGLNDPGIPISVGDLVKNEVFSRIGYDDSKAMVLHESRWIPFRSRFGTSFDDYFFPYVVIQKSNTSQTEMFGELRDQWKNLDSNQIIDRLEEFSTTFLCIKGIENPRDHYGKEVADAIKRLQLLRSPSSIYPFTMQLLRSCELKKISKSDAVGCLEAIESFLARRALCGIEPTGLLGLFRTLWSNTGQHPTRNKVEETILKRLTVEWPTDERLRESIASRPLYGATVAKYAILEFDRSMGMDNADTDATIEHVMPQSYEGSWKDDFTEKTHSKLKNTWANLIPLSEKMNSSIATDSYEVKRAVIASESRYISARKFANKHETWTPDCIQKRATKISDWAVDRWRRPR